MAGNSPDISGLVNDQQFLGLPPVQQREALFRVTGDQSFSGLSDADTMQFTSRFRRPNFAANPPGMPKPSYQNMPMQTMGTLSTGPGTDAGPVLNPKTAVAMTGEDPTGRTGAMIGAAALGGVSGVAANAVSPIVGPIARAGAGWVAKNPIKSMLAIEALKQIPGVGPAISKVPGASLLPLLLSEGKGGPPPEAQTNEELQQWWKSRGGTLTSERPTGPIHGGIRAGAFPTAPPEAPIPPAQASPEVPPPAQTPPPKTGISEENINAIREKGAESRRSNAQFIQDVIRRKGLPPASQELANLEAQMKGRAGEMAQKYPVPQWPKPADPFGPAITIPSKPTVSSSPYAVKSAPEMESVPSTNIEKVGHNGKSMWIEYKNGRTYSYDGVPEKTFQQAKDSESIGSFIASNIKGKFKTTYRGSVLGLKK